MTTFCLWVGYGVVAAVSLGVFALVAEWAVNRLIRAFGVYKLVVEFIWERARKRDEVPYRYPELHPCEAPDVELQATCVSGGK